MVSLLGVTNVNDIASLTENDKMKLSGLRGWSTKLVNNTVNNALRIAKRMK
jgi:hypothetical protein